MNKLCLASAPLNGRSGHEAGRVLLQQLYREETGLDCPDIQVSPRGKPFFAESNLYFSISHTPAHVFCVLSHVPVGIDAEEIGRPVNLMLASKILSPSEKKRFSASSDKRAALLRMWVLKEAAVKCTGEGLRGYPNHTNFSPDDPRVFERDGCYVAIITEGGENHAV